MSSRIENRERWRKILQDQQASGLSASAFCRQVGVRSSAFFKWRHKLAQSGTNPPAGFAEVKVQTMAPRGDEDLVGGSGQIELRLQGRPSIVVPRGFDRQTLIDLLDIVEARSGQAAKAKCEVVV